MCPRQLTGQWLVRSETSIHLFDMNTRRVGRIPGKVAPSFVTDHGRVLRTLDMCRVGECGRWTMEPPPGDYLNDFLWHTSTEILKIVRVVRQTAVTGALTS